MDPHKLPPYHVRVSRKARRVSLRITRAKGLEVVLPEDVDHSSIPNILHAHRPWIERHLARIEAVNAKLNDADTWPSELDLKAIDETWQLEYLAFSAKKPFLLERAGRSLVLTCKKSEIGIGFSLLKPWLRAKARSSLVPMLDQLSRETGLGFKRVHIKSQRTVWGSCSSQGSINLNDKLLFLPPDLVHYILIHELCHTRHLNHSVQFWSLVGDFEPDYKRREVALKHAWRSVPFGIE